jgi:hypothetical protein
MATGIQNPVSSMAERTALVVPTWPGRSVSERCCSASEPRFRPMEATKAATATTGRRGAPSISMTRVPWGHSQSPEPVDRG